jgi:hypothetical protein
MIPGAFDREGQNEVPKVAITKTRNLKNTKGGKQEAGAPVE